MSFLFVGNVTYICRVYYEKGRTSRVQVGHGVKAFLSGSKLKFRVGFGGFGFKV